MSSAIEMVPMYIRAGGDKMKMTADEKRWRAESDASTLKRIAELQSDPTRMREAQKLLKKEQDQIAKAMTATKPVRATARKGK